jgi:ketosteroid isomerase-like protein
MSARTRQSENVEIVQIMAANGLPGNWDVVRPFVADDIVLHVAPTLPWGGDSHGWEGYRHVLTTMKDFFAELGVGDIHFDPIDDRVVITTHIHGRVAKTGKAVSMPLVEVWRLRDGRVCEITAFFFDTKTLVDP